MDLHRALGLLFCVTTIVNGCGDDPPPEGSVEAGEAVYREPLEDGNTFACATCHALSEPADDGFVRPGHPIGDAVARSSYKDGTITELRQAVNSCVTEWMNGDPWTETDPRWTSLLAFLEAQAPSGSASNVDIQIGSPPADLSGGDATNGRMLFNTRCVVCHGEDAVGTERAPGLIFSPLDGEYVAERVRHSGRVDSPTYDGLTGGIMPFWGTDRLSDAELLDVVAYVEERSREMMLPDASTPDATMTGDGGTPDTGPSGCDSTHPRVGQTASLVTRFHGTTGTATIVDDCTIVVEDFGYDGTGIDVRFYGGLGGDYDSGFAISDDLLRVGGYSGETLTLTLPAGRTLDEMDGISLWCVAAGVSFGDGLFM
jgi:cytochrome c